MRTVTEMTPRLRVKVESSLRVGDMGGTTTEHRHA